MSQGALNNVQKTEQRKLSKLALTLISVLIVAIIAACGGGESGSGNESTEITIDGSSTVFPISQAVAEEFRRDHPEVQIPVGISGTGGGFKRFVTGETDISDASRPIKESEAALAAKNGIEYTEITVAYDGLSIVLNRANDFVTCLTIDELKSIWEPNSSVSNWNQVRSSFPDKPLRLYGPDTDSGTFDYFTAEVNGEEDASRSDYTASSDDNVLVQGVSGDQGAMGYFGFAYYTENASLLNVLSVDGGAGCVEPSVQTINDGSYNPLSREMYIYVNNASLERPEVRDFIEFYLNNAGELAEEVGYVGLPQADYQAQIDALN
ncbi:phosphate ABC transporter substrate-binding protein PstS family protein [Candidatus Lucifugimonas marina]|jgi:phosphate transport system substrate-binding protein|uniref:Phosphate-binding protein n=1 Tax=Candidatus Lucifugimonas marina TaxID=3038979 RepID=A0AAJ5ZHJ8_9CHLR|nr:phosphate ABC transporter substrate-binding protein PstS family protein [SAR202 cluster bacterium JH702]MDG0868412.1 phosphate ABC transporter substrate-binding protein PstS family protein [SAR202 cluster bacterium JH639]WFG35045.1 phosphate ABC transporter substrate-binding protein PstS family protein [SAR202 cluster bacterium JH545]WFG39002.1 phosphate ABC transporter substrate-binding protein PstS family protein [SAR202 cluster bacterium JH1073]